MNQFELQKQLLIAESELNRAQLAGDMAALADGVFALTCFIITSSTRPAASASDCAWWW